MTLANGKCVAKSTCFKALSDATWQPRYLKEMTEKQASDRVLLKQRFGDLIDGMGSTMYVNPTGSFANLTMEE